MEGSCLVLSAEATTLSQTKMRGFGRREAVLILFCGGFDLGFPRNTLSETETRGFGQLRRNDGKEAPSRECQTWLQRGGFRAEIRFQGGITF